MSEENEKKERGGCLTAFLWVFIIFAGIGVLYDIYLVIKTPGPSIIISTLISAVILVSLIAVLLWKKIGVIGYVAAEVVSTIVSVVNSSAAATPGVSPSVLKIVTVVMAVIILAIFYVLIKPVYKYMD